MKIAVTAASEQLGMEIIKATRDPRTGVFCRNQDAQDYRDGQDWVSAFE